MTAILSRVAETTTGTGTGNLTLAGAATSLYGQNVRTFSAALGGVAYTFYYDIFHQSAAEYERGIGSLSGGALVRLLVIESSNSNALVNFSAGTKVVTCAATPDDLKLEPLNMANTSATRKSFFARHGDSSLSLVAGRLYLMPYANFKEAVITGVGFNLITASATAGHVARIGLFEKTANRVYTTVQDFGTVAVDGTAGVRLITTNFRLPTGNYYVGLMVQGGTVSASEPAFWNNWAGSLNSNGGCWEYVDSQTVPNAFAASYTTTLSPIVNQSIPTIVMRTSTGLFQS